MSAAECLPRLDAFLSCRSDALRRFDGAWLRDDAHGATTTIEDTEVRVAFEPAALSISPYCELPYPRLDTSHATTLLRQSCLSSFGPDRSLQSPPPHLHRRLRFARVLWLCRPLSPLLRHACVSPAVLIVALRCRWATMQYITYEDTSPAIQYNPQPRSVPGTYAFPFEAGCACRTVASPLNRAGTHRPNTGGNESFSGASVTTAVGLNARASLSFRGSSVAVRWTQGFARCPSSLRDAPADQSGANMLVTMDGTPTVVDCVPGAAALIVYNRVAFTSPALDPDVDHLITVQLDPATNTADGIGASLRHRLG